MKASIFNIRVPLKGSEDFFLTNTLSDAQLIVSADVLAMLDRGEPLDVLVENGFLVADRAEDQRNLDAYFESVVTSNSELHITILTTLQCNFACDYCFQGDHGDYNKFAEKMTLETSAKVAAWVAREMDRVQPKKLTVIFFGGEPLLNLPVMYDLSEKLWQSATLRSIPMGSSIITNGLLLSEEIIDRMLPFGLKGVKITLDGDKDTHNRMRPLRGGQGTFDRIVKNIEKIADKVLVAIGGNFDETSADSFPALLAYLAAQPWADKLSKVNFKPIIKNTPAAPVKGMIPLTLVGSMEKPLGGSCMTSAGSGCGTDDLDGQMTFLREETKRLGFRTSNGVPGGPCHIHREHANTIGPDGSLYPCPGFTGEKQFSVGHIDDRVESWRESAKEKFNRLRPWEKCIDCAYIPTCAGGCLVASHNEQGDINLPTCHLESFKAAHIAYANQLAEES